MSVVERLAAFFRAHPDEWVEDREIALVAGSRAWRTWCPDLKREPFLMFVETRQRRIEIRPGRTVTVLEHRVKSAVPRGPAVPSAGFANIRDLIQLGQR